MADRTDVMISSTARDLPDHRKEVMDACLRQGMFPYMMEHLPAKDADAKQVSIELVDKADIYLGVFAHRYGYVPEGHDISFTEMEYNRAVVRGIPRLIFLMHKDHPLKAEDVETGEGASKLKALKERLGKERVVNFFTSPSDLRAQVINSLSQHRQPDLTTFHYVSDIPQPPEPFIAHPYTLLQAHRLVGRQPELNLLTDWVAKPDSQIFRARILNVVAVGGLGKSALTWHWFNQIAEQEMKPMAGRMWWSFYESDATFENFITRALAYVTRRPLAEVQQTPAPERETQLLAALDREPFLLVLDGLERILIAYARMDAAHLSDDDYDKRTANFVADAYGLPASAAQSFTGEHRLRKTADPRAGSFLRKLAQSSASRALVSTRLYPAELQMVTGEPLSSCAAIFLRGLTDDDALELWRAFSVSGARDTLLPIFNRAENHPLLIQALASEVARYRPAPGDFDAWRRAHPDFDPFGLPLVQVKSHVLAFALRGLADEAQQVLRFIAAFRMPARYDTLTALLIGEGKPCADERELDEVLTELEDRGLVGWDKRANRYDLHPVIRGVVWSGLSDDARRGVYASLHAHFEALPRIADWQIVNNLEDLTPAIELYNTLIGLRRYGDAYKIFEQRLFHPLLFRFSYFRRCGEVLEMLFRDGDHALLSLSEEQQRILLISKSLTCHFGGNPKQAITLLSDEQALFTNPSKAMVTIFKWDAFPVTGALRNYEATARAEIWLQRILNYRGSAKDECACELISCWEALGMTLAVRGEVEAARKALGKAHSLSSAQNPYHHMHTESTGHAYHAQLELWLGNFSAALKYANDAWESLGAVAQDDLASSQREFISAARLVGITSLHERDLELAQERLNYALTQARVINYFGGELTSLVGLAMLKREQGDLNSARELLDDVWEAAERGPYPLIHADACNVLAQVERDAGNEVAAVEAATRAYKLAWCDGPPFAYHWGLEKARKHLRELGTKEPEMPPFDASKFEPMPEVEINPPDEFGWQES